MFPAVTLALVVLHQDNFPDPPPLHWAYEALAVLKADGFAVGLPDESLRRQRLTARSDFARNFHDLAINMLKIEHRIREIAQAPSFDKPGSQSSLDHLGRARDLVHYLHNPGLKMDLLSLERAAREFAPEIKQLGLSSSTIPLATAGLRELIGNLKIAEVGSAYRQFSDVPKDHWAAKAVLDLRSEGLVWGYPDGKYRG